jgi:pyridoxamine 5'-phosphate oxidase
VAEEQDRLDRADLSSDPMEQFRLWFEQAGTAGQPEPEAMALATVGAGGPSVRYVLLRGFGPEGLVFYTNRRSRKGRELSASPRAAVVFRWALVDRQVRVAGAVEEIADSESDAYFASRPRGSQLAAWASEQSEVAADRAEVDRRYLEAASRFEGAPVPRPAWWGGYRLRPEEFEFWQQGVFRMHDRFRFSKQEDRWEVTRLFP